MVEAHGWITLRETYKVVDDDNIEALLTMINDEIEKIEYPQIQINVNKFVENHKVIEYTRADLKDPDKVGELFDYCQILEAYITKSGWDFLINHYGYDG